MTYKAAFYKDGEYLPAVSADFMKLAQGHTYQYFDIEKDGKRIEISHTAPHPPHQERLETCIGWEACIGKQWGEDVYPDQTPVFKGHSVLDLGGAEGFYSLMAAFSGASQVTMVERSSKAVECAKFIFDFFGANVDIILKDIEDLDFFQHEITLLMRVFHWFESPARERILNLVMLSTDIVTFINLDEKLIPEALRVCEMHCQLVQTGGKDFMGWIRAWK